ncbi:MAG: hypothetical protein A3H31_07445 [Gallionellales bacterium RIFCSPLOWO2_02_FULL_57_47]|nr:MAG: hypothetical protein A3H31_07445 [Gallionellales bacterium RIFCSPLOWO2_02_FULL_57_47]OGT12797.1 MAG: hypothetical protein A3J49_09060 [Gallionellales bacterium RIFCSPHIGHO2_02_FULL_57_16]
MTIQFLRQILLGNAFLIAICAASQAIAGVPIKINAWGIHQGGQIVYRYQIENNSASTIYQADLGLNSPGKELPGKPWSLNFAYSDVPVPLDAAYCKPFYFMDCTIAVFQFDYMPEPKTNISMRGVENNMIPPPKVLSGAHYIRPGTRSSVAEIYIPIGYQSPGYLTSFGEVSLLDNNTRNPDGTIVTDAVIPFTQVDVTPPALSFTLSPGMLWPPNDKLVAINATIAVHDDYDPEPEIKLESITASEPLAAGDIQDAQLGTDDRDFYLAAKRAGNNQAGRIYTVTYSATDGSGNKATASATVSVAHDQGK